MFSIFMFLQNIFYDLIWSVCVSLLVFLLFNLFIFHISSWFWISDLSFLVLQDFERFFKYVIVIYNWFCSDFMIMFSCISKSFTHISVWNFPVLYSAGFYTFLWVFIFWVFMNLLSISSFVWICFWLRNFTAGLCWKVLDPLKLFLVFNLYLNVFSLFCLVSSSSSESFIYICVCTELFFIFWSLFFMFLWQFYTFGV